MNYTEALEIQCKLMMNIARRLDEKGYAVVVHPIERRYGGFGRAKDSFLCGATNYMEVWAGHASEGMTRATRKRPVFVHVWPNPTEPDQNWQEAGNFVFLCNIPNRVRYKPLTTSINLMAVELRNVAGKISFEKKSDVYMYSGSGRTPLEILLRILEMPQHRKILLGE